MWRFMVVAAVVAVISPLSRAQSQQSKPGDTPTVLILRFDTPGDPDGADWIGRAAQEDLATDLTAQTTARIKNPFTIKPISDLDAAVKEARESHASYVVFGQAQSVDGVVRLTGRVVDVATGNPLGTLKITGPRSSLFDLEDALTKQVCALLPQELLKPSMAKLLRDDPPARAIQLADEEPAPVRIFPAYASVDYQIP